MSSQEIRGLSVIVGSCLEKVFTMNLLDDVGKDFRAQPVSNHTVDHGLLIKSQLYQDGINFEALCGKTLVTLPPGIRGSKALESTEWQVDCSKYPCTPPSQTTRYQVRMHGMMIFIVYAIPTANRH